MFNKIKSLPVGYQAMMFGRATDPVSGAPVFTFRVTYGDGGVTGGPGTETWMALQHTADGLPPITNTPSGPMGGRSS